MPLPGGPADKFGNRYELWWTIRQFVRIINLQADGIRIEDPNVDSAEFVITAGDYQELHQTKRNHSSGKWSLPELRNLLQTMFEQLSSNGNMQFVFVSGSDAPELRELTERATNASNSQEFELAFVSSKSQREAFEKLKNFWHNAETTTAYSMLRRIKVRTIDERGLEEQVRGSLPALFLNRPDEVCDALRSFAEDSIHKYIDREELISYLQSKGFSLRRLAKPNDAPALISEATNRYLEATRRRFNSGFPYFSFLYSGASCQD